MYLRLLRFLKLEQFEMFSNNFIDIFMNKYLIFFPSMFQFVHFLFVIDRNKSR